MGQDFPKFHFDQGACIHCLSEWCRQPSRRAKNQESALSFLDLQSNPHRLYLLVYLVFANFPLPLYHHHPDSDLDSSLFSLPPILSYQTGSCSVLLKLTCLKLYCQKAFCRRISSLKDQFIST
uniref:Uncharacterized protein n=1 Tax=Rousettus aegyptiacus TaxID=9407 RepID=A0A7J8ILU2_ROUAE|nr:hypothetical protein HJG63_010762 [Rousettus aegyptiacus]